MGWLSDRHVCESFTMWEKKKNEYVKTEIRTGNKATGTNVWQERT